MLTKIKILPSGNKTVEAKILGQIPGQRHSQVRPRQHLVTVDKNR